MRPESIRKILQLQAVEQADESEQIFSAIDKQDASVSAGAPLAKGCSRREENEFLARRAESLLIRLASRFPEAAKWTQSPGHGHRYGLVVLILAIAAVVVGYLSNELGPEKRINIIAFPLIGILLWSICVYVREIILFLRRKENLFQDSWITWLIHFVQPTPTPGEELASEEEKALSGAKSVFEKRWRQLHAPVVGAKLKSLLHIVAALLAASAIGGMYVKGLANEYRAVWESTFFENSSQLRPVLTTILGPATAIQGNSIPGVEELDKMQRRSGDENIEGENAARWIHWYAITIGLFVILPRLLFALLWKWRGEQLGRNLSFRTISENYFERLLATSTGTSVDLFVVPYGCDTSDSVKRAVVRTLEDRLERPVDVTWAATVTFGEEEEGIIGEVPSGCEVVPLFSFSATPEKETHLALHQTLLGQSPNPVRFVLLEADSYETKIEALADAEVRREGRLTAWTRLFETENAELLTVRRHP